MLSDLPQNTAVKLSDRTVELGTLHADSAKKLLDEAAGIATPLAHFIKQSGLASNISGKEYVRCEGWTTLAAMLGVTPHEVETIEQDGVYTSVVELRRLRDGQPVSRASAECGAEKLWSSRDAYARRSMAQTRATAKACRLAFSWIMVLGGYQPTPAEEMDGGSELPTTIPFGKDKGKRIADCSEDHLRRIREWCQEKNKFADLVEAIDLELDERRTGKDEAAS